MIEEMPLVGRVRVLERTLATLIESDGAAAFVLAGPAGVGKTRLSLEVALALEAKGRTCPRVVATRAAASIPFGAFAPLMPDPDVAPSDMLSLLRQAGDAIASRGRDAGRVVLVVDDAHLLDDGSAALVHQLVRESTCSALLTVRTAVAAPDPVTALWKDGLADRIDLDPLDEAEVQELATSALHGPLTGAAAKWLWETSAGNPMYVRELLVSAVDSGALENDNGMWTLRLPIPASARLVELASSRLAGLPPDVVDVVDLLAVGEPLELGMLAAIASADAVEAAEHQGLIALRDEGGRTLVTSSHPLYAEIRRHEMARTRVRRLSGQLADAMQALQSLSRSDELRIARWQIDAGVPGDPQLFERAARTAREMFDLDLARRLGRAAVEAGAGVEAGLAVAEAEFFSGHHVEAEAVLQQLAPRCQTDEERSRVANARAYNFGTLMGDQASAVAVLDAALAEITEPNPRERLIYRRASDEVYSGRVRTALDDARTLLVSDDDTMAHRGAQVASVALALLGHADEAVEVAYRGLDVHRRSGDATRIVEGHLIGAVLAHTAAGRFEQADADAIAGYEASLASGYQDAVASFCLLRGGLAIERGLLIDAARMFREGAAINREARDIAALRWCLGGLAVAEGMSGAVQQARAAVAELDELPPHWMVVWDAELLARGRAWSRAASGETSSARALLRDAADQAASFDQAVSEALLVHDVARLGEPEWAADRLAGLAPRVDGDFVAALATHAAALTRPVGAELEACADGFAAIGALGLAAEAAASAASAYSTEGLARRATACTRRAAELRERCSGVPAPGTGAPEPSQSAPLTRREREIAGLAAQGIGNPDIAERLFLSVRTVENHLQRVYAKLGITSRDELAEALEA
jgi:DNA-binding CsgD family transcriptional regulator